MVLNYNTGVCMECNEGIFNPICHSCLAKEIDEWLYGNGNSEIVRTKVKQLINNFDFPEGISCIICKDSQTYVCPFCFTRHVYDILISINVNKKILNEFLTFFNYDFEHTDYGKEIEDFEK